MRRLAPILALTLLSACGGTTSSSTQPSTAVCTDSGTASQDWPLPQPPPSATPPIASVTASGDTLQFTFTSGTPPYQLISQPGADFAEDPSGKTVTLAGTDGASILLTGFRGDQANYKGEKKIKSSGPRLLEVVALGDFEGTVTWGVGLSGASCAVISSSGSTLTFHFVPQP